MDIDKESDKIMREIAEDVKALIREKEKQLQISKAEEIEKDYLEKQIKKGYLEKGQKVIYSSPWEDF